MRSNNSTPGEKEKESKFVPDPIPPIPSRPVKPSMFFNPFKFKRGRRREPKNESKHSTNKKKVKGRARTMLKKVKANLIQTPILQPMTLSRG